MAPSAKFWDRIALKYAKQPVADEAAYEKKLSVTQAYFRPDWEVLEFGCGTGSTAITHSPHVRHIRAIDISPRMIEIAAGKAAAANTSNISFEVGTIEELEAPEASYDAVLGLSILHLLEDWEGAIAKVHRMVKPGGIFVSSTFCGDDSMGFLKYILPIARFFGRVPYVAFFRKQQLLDSLTKAGFEIDHEWQPGKRTAVFIVATKP